MRVGARALGGTPNIPSYIFKTFRCVEVVGYCRVMSSNGKLQKTFLARSSMSKNASRSESNFTKPSPRTRILLSSGDTKET